MASRKEVTVHLPEIYNVTEMLSSNGAGNYNCVQGYTTSAVSDVVHFITAKPDSADDNAAVGNILDQNITVSKNRVIGHASDCAYYDYGYFIVQSGGTIERATIIRLDYNLNHVATYTYRAIPMHENGKLTKISGIAQIRGNTFILRQDRQFSICTLNMVSNLFVEKSRVSISDSDWNQLERFGYEKKVQGIFCMDENLYVVISYVSDAVIKHNDIAKFSLSGTLPIIDGMVLDTIYSCDKTKDEYFEVKTISAPNEKSNLYMLVNEKKNGIKQDKIYQITLP